MPRPGDIWDGEFAELWIIATYQNEFCWVHVKPKNEAFKPSLKTMSVHAFGEMKWVANHIDTMYDALGVNFT
jgi:hypothetical protein